MELGGKIRQARLEAGMSQRQLCGEEITRNMLSQIEHGTARPSMKTLRYLANQLGKPLAWFLDENAEQNNVTAESAEYLRKAEAALDEGKSIYAAELLEKVTDSSGDIQRRKLLLSARLPGADLTDICEKLPSLDEELMLRARAALETDKPDRCLHLLDVVENQDTAAWNLLRGQLWLRKKEYVLAAECFHRMEHDNPAEIAAYLEQCYRELGDYKRAYEYACLQKR